MNNNIYKKIQYMEIENDLFSKEYNGLFVWQFIRLEVLRILLEHDKSMLVSFNTSIKEPWESLYHRFKVNPYNVKKADVMFIGIGRRNWNGRYYEDPILDDIINKFPYSYYFYEYIYDTKHYEPNNDKNVKFIERYNRKSNMELVSPKKIREINDFFIDIIHQDLGIILNNNEKERLCMYIYYLFNEYNTHFRVYIEELLVKINPKVLLMVNSPDLCNMVITQEAKKRKIPVIEIAHGMMDEYTLAYNFPLEIKTDIFPDYLLVFGDYDKNIAHYPISLENVLPIGSPTLESKEKKIKKKNDNKIVITFFTSATIKLEKYILFLANNLDMDKYKIIMKLHPHQYKKWRYIFPNISSNKNIEVVDNNNNDVYYYLIQTDYVIGIDTTILFEATYFKKKIIVIDAENTILSKPLIENGQAYLVNDEIELLRLVRGDIVFVPNEGNYYSRNAKNNVMSIIKKLVEG